MNVFFSKKIFLISIIFLFIISLLFYFIEDECKNAYQKTILEIKGIKKVENIYRLDIIIKIIRGLNQLEKEEYSLLMKSLMIDKNKVLEKINGLDDEKIKNYYLDLIKNKNKLSKIEIFDRYTNLLRMLKNKRIDIADSSYLLLETDRENYFLIGLTIFSLPEIIEFTGRIRALGTALLQQQNKKDKKYIFFMIENNINMFLEKISDIKYSIEKLSTDYENKLNSMLIPITSDFHSIVTIISQIKNNTYKASAKEYFFKSSRLVDQIYNMLTITNNMVISNLERRKQILQNELIIGYMIYTSFIFFILFIVFYQYRKTKTEIEEQNRKKKEQDFIQKLQENYLNYSSLKEFYNISLSEIIKCSKAIIGSLYLFDEENQKLYLGAVYGINSKMLKQILELRENLISQAFLEKEANVIDIQQSIDLGSIKINNSKLVTIPIIEIDKKVGSLQLLFDKYYNNINMEFLKFSANILGTFIQKSQKNEELSKLFKLIDQYILISKTDLNGKIIYVSQTFCELTQYSKEELIGKTHNILKHPDTEESIYKEMWDTITNGKPWKRELKNLKKDGSIFWIETLITPDFDINNNLIGYTAIRIDITDKKRINELAITDSLTSIYNRRFFDNIFEKEISSTKREKTLLAFIMLDIDHFKQYNDIYGHQKGDDVLIAVAETMKTTFKRLSDYVFRLGGEEFGIVFKASKKEDAINLAEKLRINIESLMIEHIKNSASKFITVSMGLYVIEPSDVLSSEEIYKKTDDALYQSKYNGRNCLTTVNEKI